MGLTKTLHTQKDFASNAIFIVLPVFLASLTFLLSFSLFTILFSFCRLVQCQIVETDGIVIEFSFALRVVLGGVTLLACKLEAATVTHKLAKLMARGAFVLLFIVLVLRFSLNSFLLGVYWRILLLEMSIHIKLY
jgi:hypothetical protein